MVYSIWLPSCPKLLTANGHPRAASCLFQKNIHGLWTDLGGIGWLATPSSEEQKKIENNIIVNIMEKIKVLDRYLIINSTLWRC